MEQNLHLLIDKIQTSLHCHHSLAPVLLEQDRPDELVDGGFVVKGGELLLV
jgi:hypothetical protein